MGFIAGKTHARISLKRAPLTVDMHIKLAAYHHHMFNHPASCGVDSLIAPGARVIEK
jgi:hypothetical protein